jgi:hypothetical protein
MRYHFITHNGHENIDPTADYVLDYLKRTLKYFRIENKQEEMDSFIREYTKGFHDFFVSLKNLLGKVKTVEPYYKLFVLLGLSARLYPLVIKLETLGFLDGHLTGNQSNHTILNLIELIEVRVYKTRGTDPTAHIARFTDDLNNHSTIEEIQSWLMWFNSYWMPKELFLSNLTQNIYGNRALNLIFVDYCEHLQNSKFNLDDLKIIVDSDPTVEHILSQTPNFLPDAFGFIDEKDYNDNAGKIGNLTALEKSINSSVQNRNPFDKVRFYDTSKFIITKKIASQIREQSQFNKQTITERTQKLAEYCSERWWG